MPRGLKKYQSLPCQAFRFGPPHKMKDLVVNIATLEQSLGALLAKEQPQPNDRQPRGEVLPPLRSVLRANS